MTRKVTFKAGYPGAERDVTAEIHDLDATPWGLDAKLRVVGTDVPRVDGLVKAIVAAQEKKIDEAVADGRITKAQATELKARLADRVEALVNGQLHRGGGPNRHGFLPGSGFPRGPPPAFWGPRA